MICPNCKNEIIDGAAFCSKCGTSFAAQTAQAEAPVQQAQQAPAYQPPKYQAPENQQPQYQQPQYQPPQYQQPQTNVYQQGGPVAQLRTNRSFIKTFLLSILTCGIYALVCYGHITDDVNLVCSRYDGKKSMNYYLLSFIVAPITLGIAAIVWEHNICERIGNELRRRQINYDFGAKDFWLWGVLGSLIVVGPFVFVHKFFKAVNLMNDSFNKLG